MLARPASIRQTVAGLLVALAVTTGPKAAAAADPAAFVEALARALAPAEVRAGGTLPTGPLLSHGNVLEALLPRTRQVMNEAVALVARAGHEILLQTYEWDDADEAAEEMLEALRARAERALAADGPLLQVRILTSRAWPAENDLSQAKLRGFLEGLRVHPRAPGRIEAEWATWRASPLAILHSKTLVVDGERALVMTGNFNTHGGIDRDSVNMAVLVRGPVVRGLQTDWQSARAQAHGEVATGKIASGHSPAADWLLPQGPLVAAILSRTSNWTYWDRGDNNPQARGILALFDAATARIDVLNPSLGVPSVQEAVVRAVAERGVRVRAILSLQMNRSRDHRFFGGDNVEQAYRLYAALLARGGPALADGLTIAWGAEDGVHASVPHSPGNVHAKAANFDGACLLLGSTNLNWLSWNNGRELSVALVGEGVSDAAILPHFEALLQTAAPLVVDDLPPALRGHTDPVANYLRSRSR